CGGPFAYAAQSRRSMSSRIATDLPRMLAVVHTTTTGRGCPASDVRVGSGEVAGSELVGGNDAEPAGLVILDCLAYFVAGVHDEGPVVGDRRADRQPADEERVERLGLSAGR